MQLTSLIENPIQGGSATWPPIASVAPTTDLIGSTSLPCQEPDVRDLWFAERGDDVERAKALCADCPLRVECLAGAVSRREPWGVWGGEVFVDGVVVARKRGRGRPRKAEVAASTAA